MIRRFPREPFGAESRMRRTGLVLAFVAVTTLAHAAAVDKADAGKKSNARGAEVRVGAFVNLRGGGSYCPDTVDQLPTSPDPVIRLYITPNTTASSPYPAYNVGTDLDCAKLSHGSAVTFELHIEEDPSFVIKGVDLEFDVADANHPPQVKGPFGRHTWLGKRGRYPDIGQQEVFDHTEIDPERVIKIGTGQPIKLWSTGYTITVWGKHGACLGESDPGVIVIDNP